MSLLFSDKNISPGGQIYDRTTGTWTGETKGNVGDGIDHGYAGYRSKVWHDANGPVGVQVHVPAFNGGSGSGSPAVNPGNGGSGPASPKATNGVPGKGGAGGKGAGSSMVVMGGPLEQKLEPEVDNLMIGGLWEANPWFSNAGDAWQNRYGEPGEWIGGVVVGAADLGWNGVRLFNHVGVEAPKWNGASPSKHVDPDPIYNDGWVSYDERQTWERAPKGSLADQYWSF